MSSLVFLAIICRLDLLNQVFRHSRLTAAKPAPIVASWPLRYPCAKTGILVRKVKHMRLVFLSLILLELVATPVRAGVEAIESSALRIELNTSPYSLRIIEKSTGEVLLSASRTAFTDQLHRVTSATDVVRASDSIQATLLLTGDSGKAKLTVAFTKPEVIQVTLEYGGGDCSAIYEEFEDHGDHYYGVWEYPFGGNIDNRGADFDFGGTRQLPDVNYSNARAPFYMTLREIRGLRRDCCARPLHLLAIG